MSFGRETSGWNAAEQTVDWERARAQTRVDVPLSVGLTARHPGHLFRQFRYPFKFR
jgi:hypothetical protein